MIATNIKKNIVFYGNCQISVQSLLAHNLKDYTIHTYLCWGETISKDDFIKLISQADIIITQPIAPNYKNTDYLHTEFVLEHSKKDAKVIIFPSLYFNFYYFDFNYFWLKNKDLLKEPSDYHYKGLIDAYINNETPSCFIENILNNQSFKSYQQLADIADEGLQELINRESLLENYRDSRDCHLIKISSFIKDHFKDKLLFYSKNHPTKYVLQHVAGDIANYLGFDTISYDKDPFSINERGILYSCIQNFVNFDIKEYKPRLSKYNLENTTEIVNKYYDTYVDINLKDLL
jgi:hypothetical protein